MKAEDLQSKMDDWLVEKNNYVAIACSPDNSVHTIKVEDAPNITAALQQAIKEAGTVESIRSIQKVDF